MESRKDSPLWQPLGTERLDVGNRGSGGGGGRAGGWGGSEDRMYLASDEGWAGGAGGG